MREIGLFLSPRSCYSANPWWEWIPTPRREATDAHGSALGRITRGGCGGGCRPVVHTHPRSFGGGVSPDGLRPHRRFADTLRAVGRVWLWLRSTSSVWGSARTATQSGPTPGTAPRFANAADFPDGRHAFGTAACAGGCHTRGWEATTARGGARPRTARNSAGSGITTADPSTTRRTRYSPQLA